MGGFAVIKTLSASSGNVYLGKLKNVTSYFRFIVLIENLFTLVIEAEDLTSSDTILSLSLSPSNHEKLHLLITKQIEIKFKLQRQLESIADDKF